MKFKYFLFFMFCLLFVPLVTYADCSDSRKAELNKFAGNVKFNYSYDVGEDGVPNFKIIISNVVPDIYVIDSDGNIYRNFENVVSSDNTDFEIYSSDPSCNYKIITRNITIPVYNIYSKLKECENSSSTLCNIWYDGDFFNKREFLRALNKEKKSKQSVDSSDSSLKRSFNINVFIIGGVILSIMIILTIILIKKRG